MIPILNDNLSFNRTDSVEVLFNTMSGAQSDPVNAAWLAASCVARIERMRRAALDSPFLFDAYVCRLIQDLEQLLHRASPHDKVRLDEQLEAMDTHCWRESVHPYTHTAVTGLIQYSRQREYVLG